MQSRRAMNLATYTARRESSRLISKVRKAVRDDAGSSLIELAFALPIYMMLIFGFISATLLLLVYSNITYTSRAAARYASVRSLTSQTPCTAASVKSFVLASTPFTDGGQLSSSSTWSPDNNVGNAVTVTVTVIYPTGLPYFSIQNLTLSSTAVSTIIH